MRWTTVTGKFKSSGLSAISLIFFSSLFYLIFSSMRSLVLFFCRFCFKLVRELSDVYTRSALQMCAVFVEIA